MGATRVKPANPKLRRGRETSQLYAAWPFAHRATPARDYVGGNGLNFSGGTAWAAGPAGPVVTFSGVTGTNLQTAANVFDPSTTDLTAAVWFRADSLATNANLVATSAASSGAWLQVVSTGALSSFLQAGGNTSAAGLVTVGNWCFAAVTAQTAGGTTTVTVYLGSGGALAQVAQRTAAVASQVGALRFGVSNNGGGRLTGAIDQPLLWTRALSLGELNRLSAQPYRIWTPRARWAEYGYRAAGGKVPWHLFFNRSA